MTVYDVARHPSTMSRDITACGRRDSNPQALSSNGT